LHIKGCVLAFLAICIQLEPPQEIPLPAGATFARRSGNTLCFSDKENYNILQLSTATLLPVLPLSQAPPNDPTSQNVKPAILVTGDNEFLICSWTGTNSLGLFITGDGDPVRGTLEFSSHPESLCEYVWFILCPLNIFS
jgi:hypothetical protein